MGETRKLVVELPTPRESASLVHPEPRGLPPLDGVSCAAPSSRKSTLE